MVDTRGCDTRPLGHQASGRCWVVGGSDLDEMLRLPRLPERGDYCVATHRQLRVGGTAANTAAALASAGLDVRLVSLVGSDEAATRPLTELAVRRVDLSRVRRGTGPTTEILLLVHDEGERTIIQRSGLPLGEIPRPEANELAAGDMVYIASWPTDLMPWLEAAGEARALRLAVPAAGGHPVACDVLIGSANDVGRDLEALRRHLVPDGPVLQALIVTDGPRGASVVTQTDAATITAPQAPVVDATGAGDAFAAGVNPPPGVRRILARSGSGGSAMGSRRRPGRQLPSSAVAPRLRRPQGGRRSHAEPDGRWRPSTGGERHLKLAHQGKTCVPGQALIEVGEARSGASALHHLHDHHCLEADRGGVLGIGIGGVCQCTSCEEHPRSRW